MVVNTELLVLNDSDSLQYFAAQRIKGIVLIDIVEGTAPPVADEQQGFSGVVSWTSYIAATSLHHNYHCG